MSTTLLSLLLILSRADLSSQEEIVPRTVSPSTTTDSSPDLSPKPTTFDLSKRTDHIPPNFCGWYSGSGYDNRWTYNDPSVTCFWNSDAKFVGDPTQPQTACIGNAELSTWSCSGSGCSTSVAKWYVSAYNIGLILILILPDNPINITSAIQHRYPTILRDIFLRFRLPVLRML
ncbi:hypothetical protein N7509_010018 [Penicillium cosmopolitanum]|uniref:Uncharacterized protein n=1 Tax=Penicillium cosmopolitanum TaxID=1131564 RepID=A0A9W9VQI0_9EURO|nr:uncharacterized protein N7509_010018 [Penicillium cosmopolitanum]KAJ5387477.1 hypothetical protein N7509_010018 [Penicillium cosmopolitanum]